MSLTELPLGTAGRIFRSKMPFGPFDRQGEIFARYLQEDVSVVVLLAGDEECREITGKDLRAFYVNQGLRVIHLPISDFSVPERGALDEAVKEALEHAERGKNVAIHCYFGVGRTGMFAACMARKKLGLGGDEAIQWVRRYIPEAVERPEQMRMVIE